MNWKDLAGRFESLGLGILKTAITAQAGPLVGGLVAGVLDTVATPEAVDAAIEADPVAATETLKPVQTEAAVIAAYESAAARAAETNTTMRAEAASGDPVQRWWRPAFAVVTMLQVAALGGLCMHDLFFGSGAAFGQIVDNWSLVAAWFAPQFALLGVYLDSRTREKEAAFSGLLRPTMIEGLIRIMKGV